MTALWWVYGSSRRRLCNQTGPREHHPITQVALNTFLSISALRSICNEINFQDTFPFPPRSHFSFQNSEWGNPLKHLLHDWPPYQKWGRNSFSRKCKALLGSRLVASCAAAPGLGRSTACTPLLAPITLVITNNCNSQNLNFKHTTDHHFWHLQVIPSSSVQLKRIYNLWNTAYPLYGCCLSSPHFPAYQRPSWPLPCFMWFHIHGKTTTWGKLHSCTKWLHHAAFWRKTGFPFNAPSLAAGRPPVSSHHTIFQV